MRLTRQTATTEIEKLFNWFPRRNITPQKEEALTEDLLQMTESWEEPAFIETCSRIRRREKFFPLPVEFESVYNQVIAEQKGSDHEFNAKADYERRVSEEKAIYDKILSLPHADQLMLMEQATDEIDSTITRLKKAKNPDEDDSFGQKLSALAVVVIRHRDDAIRGRVISLYRENFIDA